MTQGAQALAGLVDVSRETLQRLEIYSDLLIRWNKRINLVAPQSIEQLWGRHFLDSAQIFGMIPVNTRLCADFGSGGGFPGLVAAILGAELTPHTSFSMVEADQRKSVFLKTVVRETGIKASVFAGRIEELPKLNADVITARALAPLSKLLAYAEVHGQASTRCIFLKGERHRREIDEALENWSFDCKTYPSKTDADAVILVVGDIKRV